MCPVLYITGESPLNHTATDRFFFLDRETKKYSYILSELHFTEVHNILPIHIHIKMHPYDNPFGPFCPNELPSSKRRGGLKGSFNIYHIQGIQKVFRPPSLWTILLCCS